MDDEYYYCSYVNESILINYINCLGGKYGKEFIRNVKRKRIHTSINT